MGAPRVSVIIPCLDEERFIGRCLSSILDGTTADLEVLVVDGGSRDGTRELVARFAEWDPRVRLVDNPKRFTPAALNLGIRESRGAILIRADAHSDYPPDYVQALVTALEESGADMVGPSTENFPSEETAICHAIALATNSPFGTGSRFRYRRVSGPVDAVQLGCWRRELFDRVGYFDERLLRNQDNEHSSRILARGGRLHMNADVRIKYYPRPSLAKICGHGAANGEWNAFTQALHPYTFRWRHFLPAIFFLGVIFASALAVIGVASGEPAIAALGGVIVLPYVLANLTASLQAAWSQRRWRLAPLIAVVLASYHFSYGWGITKGWALVASGGWRRRLGGGHT